MTKRVMGRALPQSFVAVFLTFNPTIIHPSLPCKHSPFSPSRRPPIPRTISGLRSEHLTATNPRPASQPIFPAPPRLTRSPYPIGSSNEALQTPYLHFESPIPFAEYLLCPVTRKEPYPADRVPSHRPGKLLRSHSSTRTTPLLCIGSIASAAGAGFSRSQDVN